MELIVENINTYYGLSHILFDVSLQINQGEVVVLLGRNGAGKTTTMLSVMGINPPKSGKVMYRNEEITGRSPYKIARLGIGFVPEDRRIFPDLTVYGNLDVGRRSFKNNSQMDAGAHLSDVSDPKRFFEPAGGHPERGGAADVNHSPHPDGGS